MSNVTPIRPNLAGQLRESIAAVDNAKDRGESIKDMYARIRAQREERRRSSGWLMLAALANEARRVIRRDRNEDDCCASCGEAFPPRVCLVIADDGALVCGRCGR